LESHVFLSSRLPAKPDNTTAAHAGDNARNFSKVQRDTVDGYGDGIGAIRCRSHRSADE